MRTPLLLPLLFGASGVFAQAPTFQWAETVPNVATPGQVANVRDADVAADGTIYVSGSTSGPRAIVADTIVEGTYVARYDTSGNCLWARSPGGGVVALSSSGDLYVASSFSGSMQFGPSSLTAAGEDVYVAKYDANGAQLWARSMGGALDDVVYDIATDGLGRVHVSGHFRGTATFGPTTLVATHDTTGFHATLDADGNFQWAVLVGGFETWNDQQYPVYYNALACDALGNSYVAGIFGGTASFGSTTLTTAAFDQVFLACFDPGGNCSWVQNMGANYGNVLVDIEWAAPSGIYVTGFFWAPQAEFGSTTITNTSTNNDEIFLTLYDPSGNALWAEAIAPYPGNEKPLSLDVDDAGNAWMCGSAPFGTGIQIETFPIVAGRFLAQFDATGTALFAGNIVDVPAVKHVVGADGDHFLFGNHAGAEFDPGSGVTVDPALAGSYEGYLAHYHDDLSFHWLQRLGLHGGAYDAATSVVADGSGNVYSTGLFHTTAIICDDTLRAPLAASHLYLNKRDASGNCLWTVQIPCSEPAALDPGNAPASLARDANGDLYFTGRFFGTIDFGIVQLTSAGRQDLFLAKYDANGNCLWAIREGGSDEDEGAALGIDNNGELLLTGCYKGNVNVAGTPLTSQGFADGFLAKYDANGNGLWARSFGGASSDNGYGLAVDGTGNSYVTGRYTMSATFGALTVNGTGDADLFLAKYDPSGDLIWLVGSTDAGWKQASAVVVGATGQIYMTGSYTGNLSICTNALAGDPTSFHAFLSCFDSDGDLLWQDGFPSLESRGYALAARPAGDIVLSGSFSGSMQVGALSTTGNGSVDPFVAAFNSAGEELWAQAMSGNDFWDFGSAGDIAADEQTVYAVGSFGRYQFSASDQSGGSMAFFPGDPGSVRFAPNAGDSYIVKYGSAEQISPPYNPLGCDGTVQVVGTSRPSFELSISPNPVDRYFTLTTDAHLMNASVIVRDMTGRVVNVVSTIGPNAVAFDVGDLRAGAYSVTVRHATGSSAVRFVKD